MTVTCPKCGAVRKESDTAPDWQCPACGVAYAKVGQQMDASYGRARPEVRVEVAASQRFPFFKVGALILLCAAVVVWTQGQGGQKGDEWASVTEKCKAGQAEVVMFARTDCMYCVQAKAYLRANNICYTAKITDRDEAALEEFQQVQGIGVPLLFVDGKRSDGFNKDWMKAQLKRWL